MTPPRRLARRKRPRSLRPRCTSVASLDAAEWSEPGGMEPCACAVPASVLAALPGLRGRETARRDVRW